jgi:hypothetical protein
MKKSPLHRYTPLDRGTAELSRETPLRKRNPERKARLFDEQFGSVARVRWFQMQECAACHGWPSECAHVRSRGAGGKAEDCIPLCKDCHARQHTGGWAAIGLDDPSALADLYDARYREHAA